MKNNQRRACMPVTTKYCFIFLLAGIFYSLPALCQPSLSGTDTVPVKNGSRPDTSYKPSLFFISHIYVSGNRKTRKSIIERELPFSVGEGMFLPDLVAKFRRAKELLINTRLFNDVVISIRSFRGYEVDIQIDVAERWYIFPVPYFKPADRNFSAWADSHYSIDRVNYGVKFIYNNFTGRNDNLKLWFITGYSRQYQLGYSIPFIDKEMKHGLGFGLLYASYKEINISTQNNQQVFLNAGELPGAGKYLSSTASASLTYYYRPALTTRHIVKLSLSHLETDSAVLSYNPKYLGNNLLKLTYPELSYTLEYQKVDYLPYVLRGIAWDLSFLQRGFSSEMHLSQFTGRFNTGLPLGHQFFAGFQGLATVKLPFEQPYVNQRLLGYGENYLRGLERYVVDGVAGGLLRTTLRRSLFKISVNTPGLPTLKSVPFTFYAKVFGDLGYAYDSKYTENSLVNSMLHTYGAGIDIVSAYDFVFRCEYSVNQFGQKGFYFHLRNDF